MHNNSHHQAVVRSLEINSNQWTEDFQCRTLTSSEEDELEALRENISAPLMSPEEFMIFQRIVEEEGGQILPAPESNYIKQKTPQSKFTKIYLKKDLYFSYSGKALILFPRGLNGYLVDSYDDLKGVPQEEIEVAKLSCNLMDNIPAVIENKLITLSKGDFGFLGENYACA